jgi:hypothetical protein
MTTVRSVVVKLKADVSDFNRDVLGAAAAAKTLPDSLAASAAKARGTLSSLELELRKIAASRYDATVVLEDTEAAARLDALNARLDLFGTKVSDARVDVDDAAAMAKISGIEAALLSLANTTARPDIDLQGVAKAEAQIATLEAQLHSIGSDVGGGNRGGLGGLINGLDDSNSRMSNLIQTAVALGPALIPVLGGAAVAAGAVGTSLTFAAAGAGVAALALHGVGDSLSALNKYQMDPTQANLDALRLKLDQLGPAGQNFVVFLDKLGPKLHQLQDTAEAGFLPGLQSGISQVMQSFPAINSLVDDLSTTLGGLADEAGHAFQSPFWQGFLQTFSANASTELAKFAEGIGNITTGLAGMFEAFLPASTDFTSHLLTMSQNFSQWGQTLSQNQGFQDFITYLRDNGPNAAAALGAIADAFISIIQAGAPVGAIVLPIITDLAKALSAIANSPAGPVLFGLAAGVAALARAFALLKVLNATALVGAVTALGGAEMTMGAARLQLLAGGVAALVLSLTSLDDKAGLSNTLMGGALGFAVKGGWGAAIGGAIGLTKDLAAANDDLEKSMASANDTFDSQAGNLKADANALKDLIAKRDAYQAKLHGIDGKWFSTDLHDIPAGLSSLTTKFSDLFTNTAAESDAAVTDMTAKLADLKSGWTAFAHDLGGNKSNIAEISDALQGMGYSVKYINDVMAKHNKTGLEGFTAADSIQWETLIRGVKDYIAAADSVPGRTKAVNDAIAGLDDELQTTATSADALKAALDALLSPQMNLIEANDAWNQGLRDLDSQLAKHTRSLVGNTTGAAINRGVILDQVKLLEQAADAGAQAGESAQAYKARLMGMYDGLIKAGTGAGIMKGQLVQLLRTIGLTPHEINILVRAQTKQAEQQAKDVIAAYNALPKDVRTDIAANGVPADATVKSLMDKYDGLSRKQVETILQARDNASVTISHVLAHLLNLDGQTATTYINTVVTQTQINKVLTQLGPSADGNLFEFANGGYPPIGGQQPQIQPNHGKRGITWAETGAGPWEAFISGAPEKAPRSRAIADDVVGRLGGVVQWMANGGIGLRGAPAWSPAATQQQRVEMPARFLLTVDGEALRKIMRGEAQVVVQGNANWNQK